MMSDDASFCIVLTPIRDDRTAVPAPLAPLTDPRIYANVYFRLNAGYQWGPGWTRPQEDVDAWATEADVILQDLGFKIIRPRDRGVCTMVARGPIEGLYLHPMDFSGWVAEDSIPEIDAALSTAKTFKHRVTDVCARGYNFTESEFQAELDARRGNIEDRLREMFRTKRRNLWKRGAHAVGTMKSGVPYVDRLPGLRHSALEGAELAYVSAVFDAMLANGEIIHTQDSMGDLYRTRSHRDPKGGGV